MGNADVEIPATASILKAGREMGTDGKVFLERPRQDETVQRIPVFFFSAGSAQNLQQEIIKKADAFIKKPFSEADLLSTIKMFLDGR